MRRGDFLTAAADLAGSLSGKVVWVTGAAGGIGTAVCEAFSGAGSTVVATDTRPIERTSAAHSLICDVSQRVDVERAARKCESLGGVDVLVNCAGMIRREDVLDITPQVWDALFAVNVKGAFLCSQAAVKSMIAGDRSGAIVNIGSINAEKVFPDTVLYCTSKGALHGMGRAMALSLAKHGIRVNTIAPGAIADTDLERVRWAREGERDRMRDRTPLRALGESTDVASAAVFLASAHARFITGATLFVDGGRAASV
jgi:NAD(P)-dependent dehydrogenase (short-subunit alcohol dehydrogenase family)